MYDKNEIEKFFQHGDETITDYNVILCTEKGTIAFLNQYQMIACIMRYGGMYGNGFEVMQYCTDHQNKWTNKIQWIPEDYWNTQKESYKKLE